LQGKPSIELRALPEEEEEEEKDPARW